MASKISFLISQDPRWISEVNCIDSFKNNPADDLRAWLKEIDRPQLIIPLEQSIKILPELRKFFAPFKDAIERLKGHKQPTLHEVMPQYFKLLAHIHKSQESNLEGPVAKEMMRIFTNKWTMPEHVLAAATLHPFRRGLEFMVWSEYLVAATDAGIILPTIKCCYRALVRRMRQVARIVDRYIFSISDTNDVRRCIFHNC